MVSQHQVYDWPCPCLWSCPRGPTLGSALHSSWDVLRTQECQNPQLSTENRHQIALTLVPTSVSWNLGFLPQVLAYSLSFCLGCRPSLELSTAPLNGRLSDIYLDLSHEENLSKTGSEEISSHPPTSGLRMTCSPELGSYDGLTTLTPFTMDSLKCP